MTQRTIYLAVLNRDMQYSIKTKMTIKLSVVFIDGNKATRTLKTKEGYISDMELNSEIKNLEEMDCSDLGKVRKITGIVAIEINNGLKTNRMVITRVEIKS